MQYTLRLLIIMESNPVVFYAIVICLGAGQIAETLIEFDQILWYMI